MKSLLTTILLLLILIICFVPLAERPVHAVLGGAYQTVSYSSSNFGTYPSGTMTWSPGTQVTYRYNVDVNNRMHLMVDVKSGSISGTTASQFITVKIPEGRTAVNTLTSVAQIATDDGNSGTWQTGYCLTSAGSGLLYCRLASGANFSTVSNTFRFDINNVLEVSDAP